MVTVCSVTFLVIFLEDRPGGILNHFIKIPPCLSIFHDGLLGQDRMNVESSDGPEVSGSGHTQTISCANGRRIFLKRDWLCVRKKFHQALCISSREVAELERQQLVMAIPLERIFKDATSLSHDCQFLAMRGSKQSIA